MNPEKKPKLSVVIPCFNSAEYIENTVGKVYSSLLSITNDFELILINDGSMDNTGEVLQHLHQEQIRVINLSQNVGQVLATQVGYLCASGKYVITMDDDLQFPPRNIEVLLTSIKNSQALVVSGKYTLSANHKSLNFKSLVETTIYLFFPRYRNSSYFTSLKIFHKEALEKYTSNIFYFWEIPPKKISTVSVEKETRKVGKSNYNFKAYYNTFKHVALKMLSKLILLTSPLVLFFTPYSFLLLGLATILLFSLVYLHHYKFKSARIYENINQ